MRGSFSARQLGLVGLCVAACVHVAHEAERPWKLFTLSPLPGAEPAESTGSPGPAEPVIGIGPVHLPGYLDQDQIVTRVSQNRFFLSDGDRWAEPLEDNISHVLAQNLTLLLQTDRVILHPWPAQQRPAWQLDTEILNFETDTAGTAQLAARWSLRDLDRRETVLEQETRLTAAAGGASTDQSVASLSRALGDFSVEIANQIRKLVHPAGESSH